MTIPLPPSIPDPSNQDTFNDNMYPFMRWMADAVPIMNTVGLKEPRQQALHTLQVPYRYGAYLTNNNSLSTGATYYFPFYVYRQITLTSLATYSSAGTRKLCIANEANGKPSSLLVATAHITNASTGYTEGLIDSTTLYPQNMYFFGVSISTGTTYYYSIDALTLMPSFTDSTTIGASPSYCYKVTETYANAFTTFTGFTQSTEATIFYSKGAYL